jgi:hypothetical protein
VPINNPLDAHGGDTDLKARGAADEQHRIALKYSSIISRQDRWVASSTRSDSVVFTSAMITMLPMAMTMVTMIVIRSIFFGSDEIDGPITGMVLMTVFAPVPDLPIDTRCHLPRKKDVDIQIPSATNAYARNQHGGQNTQGSCAHLKILQQIALDLAQAATGTEANSANIR